RAEHPTFRRRRFLTENSLTWLRLDGAEMTDGDWETDAKAIGAYLDGDRIGGRDPRGERVVDDDFLLYFNANGATEATLPKDLAPRWDVVVDTGGSAEESYAAG